MTSYITSQVVYSTGTSSLGTSQVVVTQVISTVISTATKEVVASSSSTNQNKSNKHIGAIVGGVVGGVVGLVALVILALLLMKKISKKREAERLERDYQEAIKPRAFGLTSTGMIANKDIEKSYPESSSGRNSGFSNNSNGSNSRGGNGEILATGAAVAGLAAAENNNSQEESFARPVALSNRNNRVSEYDINKEFESGYVDQQIKNGGNPFSDKHETTSDLNIDNQDGQDHNYAYSDEYAGEDEDGSDSYVDFGNASRNDEQHSNVDSYTKSENGLYDQGDDLDEEYDDDENAGNGLTVANPDSD